MSEHSVYGLLADALVSAHLLYVLFTVGGEACVLLGGALGWSWVRNRPFRVVHLAAVVLVAVEAAIGILCPLTTWEYELRRLAGQTVGSEPSLVARLIHAVIYYDFPDWFFLLLYVAFGTLVAATWALVRPRSRRS